MVKKGAFYKKVRKKFFLDRGKRRCARAEKGVSAPREGRAKNDGGPEKTMRWTEQNSCQRNEKREERPQGAAAPYSSISLDDSLTGSSPFFTLRER